MAPIPSQQQQSHIIAGLLVEFAWYLVDTHPADPVARTLALKATAFVNQITPDRKQQDVEGQIKRARRDAGFKR